MEYQAVSKYIRISTRKVRLIADSIRKLAPDMALVHLSELPKSAAKPLADTIRSAIANAVQKQVARENLKFKVIEVMGGPVMKRWRAVSRGQAHPYKKRMTHVRVVLIDESSKS